LEVSDEARFEFVEVGAVFGVEDEDLAGEAFAVGVEVGDGFARVGCGAGGFLGVAAVGGDLLLGGHGGWVSVSFSGLVIAQWGRRGVGKCGGKVI